ncbi:tyrosine-type recombinase/integrase [Luteibacter pinisoli]|uniref:tyrosine-type recombinase/integrase n=1 Tax=Luteibacter pinisoli TaxID=2589080 RepID=UPI0014775C22|nr:integrase family protein [Luteibacter pinisoli]
MAAHPALTQKHLNAIKPTDKQVDYPDGAVRGLALRVSPGGARTWVLVKRIPDEGVKRIRLGHYTGDPGDHTPPPVDQFPTGLQALSLKQAREEATRVLALINAGRSPSKERRSRRQQAAVHAQRGSFADLLTEYIAHREEGTERRAAATVRQVGEWRRIQAQLERDAGDVLAMTARDVEPSHIVALLRPIFHHGVARPKKGRGSAGRRAATGAQGSADKVHTFLRAAFAYGLSSENSVARRAVTVYGLVHNPVDPVPREARSTPGTRALSAAELRQFYLTIDKAPKVGPVLAELLRFTIASGGQRTHQLAREPWTVYDRGAGTVTLTDRKGRGGAPRPHMVPMSKRMAAILAKIEKITGSFRFPWATNGRSHVDIASPAGAVRYWLESDFAVVDGKRVAPFTPRDLRRTCTQLMKVAGIPDDLADRLQSHGVSGITNVHYRNNPELYLPEKRQALQKFETALGRILKT